MKRLVTIEPELETRVRAAFSDTFLKVVKHFPTFPKPRLRFFKGTRSAGWAISGYQWEIRLSADFLKSHEAEMIRRTIPHEMAHLVVSYMKRHSLAPMRAKPHGPEWRKVMRTYFDVEPTRCHSYSIDHNVRRQARWAYDCPGCGKHFSIPTATHNKIRRGSNRVCKSCKTRIRYVGPLEEES